MYQPWLWLEGTGNRINARAQRRIHQMCIAQRGLHLAVPQQLAYHFQRGPTLTSKDAKV